jgi:hypothetical protein
MKIKILLLVIAAGSLASCSTAYKSGQTPDDLYYSPVRVVEEKETRREEVRRDTRFDNYEDRAIIMSTRDRRWRDLDDDYDYNCSYDPYRYGYNHGYYYNPYYYNRPVYLPGYVIVNPKNSTPRMTNLGSYNSSTLVVADSKTGDTKWVRTNRAYNNSNSTGSGINNNGSFIRRIITPSDNNSSGSSNNRSYGNENNTRTYNPPSSNQSSGSGSSSSSSGSSSSGSSVPRPARGN